MKKRTLLIAAVLAAVGIGILTLAVIQVSEPSYDGKALSTWLKRYDNSVMLVVATRHPDVDEAIYQVGTNALPYLVKMACAKDSSVKQRFMKFLASVGRGRISFTPAIRIRIRAYCGLKALGPKAKPAIPLLVESLDAREPLVIKSLAAHALARIGLDGIKPLQTALTNNDWEVRKTVAFALGDYNEDEQRTWSDQPLSTEELVAADAQVIPVLVGLLSDTNSEVRSCAIVALGKIHKEPGQCVPVLANVLKDRQDKNRVQIPSALKKYGSEARLAVPALIYALDDPFPLVRQEASRALSEIDPEAAAKAGVK